MILYIWGVFIGITAGILLTLGFTSCPEPAAEHKVPPPQQIVHSQMIYPKDYCRASH